MPLFPEGKLVYVMIAFGVVDGFADLVEIGKTLAVFMSGIISG